MDTPSKTAAPSHRLLYRGSLSLPDSHLLLDGLSFTVKLGDAHGSPALLNNTLALTLESLRGLPLHLIGTVRVKDTWIEPPGDINVDIHPDSTLTRIYFENIFCLTPITSPDSRSEYGVRVSLTDNNDPDTPDLLIYGELRDASPTSVPTVASTSASPPKVLHLLAARILPGPPPPPSFRLPRPDDPTPRRPPQTFGAKRKRDTSGVPFDLSGSTTSAEGSKRAKTVSDAKGKGRASAHDEALRKAAAETMLRIPKPQRSVAQQVDVKALGKDARVGVRKEKDKEKDRDVFKVPSVPARATLARTASETDVFGSLRGGPLEGVVGDATVEKENKTVVKRIVARRLEQEGIGKTHGEFQEVYQMCYRGASFALRRRMAVGPLDVPTIEHIVDAHIRLYVRDAPS
ncbi:hypothetical protein C8Q76DRAFT_641219 [Earliella scabrosa]|nr:hypothetical protein C8Q76DRAFT_641219 [Earliella scabrosa]